MIDTHCHIDEEAFDADREQVIERQKEAGVSAIVVPGVNVGSLQSVMDVCERYPHYLFPALGLHPEDVKANWQTDLEQIRAYIWLHRKQLVAIGEIGLDYYWDTSFKQEQQEAFRSQLQWAQELDLPVIIHNREATEDILRILSEFNLPQGGRYRQGHALRGVFHCFTGSCEVAKRLIDMGFMLGIGGVLTFKNCKLREHLGTIPMDCLVLETDSPYLTPVPHRGERNESRWITLVMEELSRIYQVAVDDIDRITTQNAKVLFRL